MSRESVFVTAIALLLVVSCQSLPHFEQNGYFLSNNSFILSFDFRDGYYALNCVTDNVSCCNNTDVGGWRDERGRPVYLGADGVTCLYVTRGDGVISLHRKRKRGCADHTSGLWRCDIPDSSGEMQSLYAYIGYERYSNPPPGKDRYSRTKYLVLLSLLTALEYRTTEQLSVYELHSTH